MGSGYADGRSYADGPRRRISSGPDGLVYADGPVGIDGCTPTAFLRLRPVLGRRHRSSIDEAVGASSYSGSAARFWAGLNKAWPGFLGTHPTAINFGDSVALVLNVFTAHVLRTTLH